MLRTCVSTLAAIVVIGVAAGAAEEPVDSAAVSEEDGKYYDADGVPTYNVEADGTVDWYTYSGFRRYHSECHTCHGPDGMGSTYAPAMTKSLKEMSYSGFLDVVVNGRENVSQSQQSVMPSFGLNKNVMCYLDDIYVYLRARADDAIPRGRPGKRADKPEAAQQAEDACFGSG